MKPILICALLGGLLGSGLAYTQTQAQADGVPQATRPAQGSPARASKRLAKFEEQFSAADTDHDGALTREEAEAAGLKRIVDNFDRLDANKDGKVTREEIRALIRSRISS
ncbi:EF-hand domain-containing protein [Noviherbaspirillum galbum]|uniref:EF-hand domain-containing protein n=1 Tax=Noviherbaspirillum galbum TaxID=2709383 RepID=A0A6B3SU87_9BURK|nr:EF-hand domain-containing protein [Noviherbaspirillum galbum]NEX64287.1 EF-hand domain-containing protein [Noviherbaspirillum galbum]